MNRADQRAQRLEDRLVALSARLSAAEDRAETARDQLSRGESKLVTLRRRLDRAQEEALRLSADFERESLFVARANEIRLRRPTRESRTRSQARRNSVDQSSKKYPAAADKACCSASERGGIWVAYKSSH